MISKLADEVIAHTTEYAKLQTLVSQADAISEITSILATMHGQLSRWAEIFVPIYKLIESERAEALRQEAIRIGQQLSTARDELESHNLVVTKVTPHKVKIDKLISSTSEAWCDYAKAKVAPLHELAQIARRLPKMSGNVSIIEGHLSRTESRTNALPKSAEALKEFHIDLARLYSLLRDLEGLPSDVRFFLNKLISGTATFADVTPTVLEWCKTEGLSDKMRITRL